MRLLSLMLVLSCAVAVGGSRGAWERLWASGRVYDMPIAEAHRALEKSGLPPMVLDMGPRDFEVEDRDPSKVVWIVKRHGSELLRFVAELSAVSETSTRVSADVAGPTDGPFGNVAQRLADHRTIAHLYIAALEEQLAATLEHRAFRIEALYPAMVAAAVTNIGESQRSPDGFAEVSQKRDRK